MLLGGFWLTPLHWHQPGGFSAPLHYGGLLWQIRGGGEKGAVFFTKKNAVKLLGDGVGVQRHAPILALEQKQIPINRINKKKSFKKRKEFCVLPSSDGIGCSSLNSSAAL